MKRFYVASLGAIAVIASQTFVGVPIIENMREAGAAYAQNVQSQTQQQSQVQLNLGAQKKVVQKDRQGKEQVNWQTLKGNALVQPGDVIRYTVNGKNNSDRAVRNLVVTQPIPKQTTYVLNSVSAQNSGAKITYSIDNGKSFVEKPTITVKLPNGKVETRPAPAELYTHVRFKFEQSIAPAAAVNATYQVKVRS